MMMHDGNMDIRDVENNQSNPQNQGQNVVLSHVGYNQQPMYQMVPNQQHIPANQHMIVPTARQHQLQVGSPQNAELSNVRLKHMQPTQSTFKKPRKQKQPQSGVWNYFLRLSQGENTLAVCNACKWTTKLYGSSTSNMRRHLEKKHNLSKEDLDSKAPPKGEGFPSFIDGKDGNDQELQPMRPSGTLNPLENFQKDVLRNQRARTRVTHKSYVWQYFTRVEQGKNVIAICDICKWTSKLYGSSTSNIRRHLIKTHNITDDKAPKTGTKRLHNEISTSNAMSHRSVVEVNHASVGEWITTQDIPFSAIVAGANAGVLQGSVLSSFKSISSIVEFLDTQHSTKSEEIVSFLEESSSHKISLSIDSWSMLVPEGFVVLWAHFIDNHWNAKSVILKCFKYEGLLVPSETANFIHEAILKYKVHDHILTFTYPETSYFSQVLDHLQEKLSTLAPQLNFFRIPCIAYNISSVLQGSFDAVRPALEKLKKQEELWMVDGIPHQTLLNAENRMSGKTQFEDLLPRHEGHWSTLLKPLGFYKSKKSLFLKVIDQVLQIDPSSAFEQVKLSNDEWNAIVLLHDILSVGDMLIKVMDRGQSTLSTLAPLHGALISSIMQVKYSVQKLPKGPCMENVHLLVEQLFDKLHSLTPILDSDIFVMAATLDPRVRLPKERMDKANLDLEKLVKQSTRKPSSPHNSGQESSFNNTEEDPSNAMYKYMFDTYNKNIEEEDGGLEEAVKSNITLFGTTRLDTNANIFEWWKSNQSMFAGIAPHAKGHLCSPCFSCPPSGMSKHHALDNLLLEQPEIAAKKITLKNWFSLLSKQKSKGLGNNDIEGILSNKI